MSISSRQRAAVRATAAIVWLLAAFPIESFAQVGEIVVTTRRREEALQDVPISVSPITPEQIARQGISDLGDIAEMSPSFQYDTAFGPQDVRITIRGLSNTRGRSNVAFLVDGIDVTTENLIAAGSGLLANRRLLTDVERIELVKGPQSALYGRAAFAGAISYITKEPGDELEGRLGVDVGDYGRRTVDGTIGGPINDQLGLRLSGVLWNEDGYYRNSVSGDEVGDGDGYGVALTGVYRPMDSMKWKARLEYSDEDHGPAPSVRLYGERYLPYPAEANTPNPVNCAQQQQRVIDERAAAGLPPPGTFTCFPGRITESQFFIGVYNHSVERGEPGLLPFKLPSTYGSVRGKQIRLSENPWTGEDFAGDTMDVFRGSLVGSWDLDFGTFSSYTGYTDADFAQNYDQDYQASGRPDALIAEMWSDTDSTTRQFSQELRFQTKLDGPVQLTGGVLYWNEERDLLDNNGILACLPVERDFSTTPNGVMPAGPGLCDGTLGTVSSWQEYARQLQPSAATLAVRPDLANYQGAEWAADTDHWSYYGMLEWEITDALKLTVEDRYVVEDFSLQMPNQSSCTVLGVRTVFFEMPMYKEGTPEAILAGKNDAMCEALQTMRFGYNPGNTSFDWKYISGNQKSRFHTPKATLDWKIADDRLLYFSWARAQKPGGLSTLSPGGEPIDIDSTRFKPEKMEAWELGLKSTWEAAGALQFNTAFFFEDYTDKQVTTQEVVNEQLQPRVVNASAAEVWGAEVEFAWQPDLLEGLMLTAAYTWLDAEYSDFIQQTRSIARIVSAQGCDAVPVTTTVKDPSGPAGDAVTITPYCRLDYSGHKLERTPENALLLTAQLQRQFLGSNYDWLAEISANFQDDRFLDDDNFTKFESYWMVDARLGLTSNRAEILLYAENLFDDDTLKSGGSGPDFAEQVSTLGFTAGLGVSHYFGTLPQPRVVGMRLGYRF